MPSNPCAAASSSSDSAAAEPKSSSLAKWQKTTDHSNPIPESERFLRVLDCLMLYIYIHLSQGPLKTRLEEEDAHLFFSPLCVACHCILLSYQPHHMQVSAIGWLSQELTSLTTPPGQGQVADHSDHQQSVALIGQSH